ncbi:MAG: hypothetical protein AAF216_09540 [Pseudomonadota bacterium]
MAIKLPGGWTLARGPAITGTDIAVQAPVAAAGDEVIEAVILDDAAPAAPVNAPRPVKTEKPPKRPALVRILGIGIWGWAKLIFLCILIGSGILLVEETQRATEENVANAAADAARQVYSGALWAVRNFWQPALAGAAVVMPVWILWRLVTLPFRK